MHHIRMPLGDTSSSKRLTHCRRVQVVRTLDVGVEGRWFESHPN